LIHNLGAFDVINSDGNEVGVAIDWTRDPESNIELDSPQGSEQTVGNVIDITCKFIYFNVATGLMPEKIDEINLITETLK